MRASILADAYSGGFLGYGCPLSPVWVIGIEEGAGSTLPEVRARLETWDAFGRPASGDYLTFLRHWGGDTKYSNPPHRTLDVPLYWKKVVSYLLGLFGAPHSPQAVRWIFENRIGRCPGAPDVQSQGKGDKVPLVAAFELFALPAPGLSKNRWFYSRWTDAPHLQTRKAMETAYLPTRVQLFTAAATAYKPALVVLFGKATEMALKSKLSALGIKTLTVYQGHTSFTERNPYPAGAQLPPSIAMPHSTAACSAACSRPQCSSAPAGTGAALP